MTTGEVWNKDDLVINKPSATLTDSAAVRQLIPECRLDVFEDTVMWGFTASEAG